MPDRHRLVAEVGDVKAKDGARPRFDGGALRGFAGAKAFARGEAYYRDGQVQILAIEPRRVLARVAGTEEYRTELTGHDKHIEGECSCRAFEDWGFCKHMVATALAANAAGGDAEAEGAGALARIRDHLKKKGVEALVEMILAMAERDLELFRRLDMAAAVANADDGTLEAQLRKALDNATRTSGFVDYREASDWAADVDAALDAVADLASGGRAGLALKLVARTIERIEQAAEDIDDSGGHCGGLLERARDIHLAAARAVRPEPVPLARDLFTREMEDDYGTFDGTVRLYADVLGEEGLAEYRRLAAESWAKLPSRSGKGRSVETLSGDHHRLLDILDFFAERDGDVDTRIALRAKDLSSPWAYVRLAEFCLAHGREEEALSRAEEGLWMFEDDRPDERLAAFAADLLSNAGRKEDAEACLWRAFGKAPSITLYERLRRVGGEAVRERAVKFLESCLAGPRRTRWNPPAEILIRVLMREKMFDAAWAAVRKHGGSVPAKEILARASEATHPREALAVYAERVERLAGTGGNTAYAEAAELIAHMAGLRSATEQAAYVAAVKVRHGRKRNFMKPWHESCVAPR